MFPRVTKVGKGENAREYLQILESYRKDVKPTAVTGQGRVIWARSVSFDEAFNYECSDKL